MKVKICSQTLGSGFSFSRQRIARFDSQGYG